MIYNGLYYLIAIVYCHVVYEYTNILASQDIISPPVNGTWFDIGYLISHFFCYEIVIKNIRVSNQ